MAMGEIPSSSMKDSITTKGTWGISRSIFDGVEDILYLTFPFSCFNILLLWFLFLYYLFLYLFTEYQYEKNKNVGEVHFKHANRRKGNSSASCLKSIANMKCIYLFWKGKKKTHIVYKLWDKNTTIEIEYLQHVRNLDEY